ncbi:RagB/SusD family nutrient uptake outer membrane protein, partial [Salmonella sp. gx-f7]|nr:RagB/SusD family nutrient uptake outer membrane protein [Salmonella sp. gx-f7]
RDDLVRFGLFTSGKNWDWKNADCLGSDVDSHFNLFPIPETEITNNPTIKQNPGY